MDDERATWAPQRRQAVDGHAAALEAERAAEAAEGAAGPPRLIVGAGGGDGETMSLAELLERRLDAGVTWP
ncbi:MAG: hypothetical protein QOH97_1507 [Actinoplanes sp.]|jgi:hypothetical protein|nr:hypothetical protein [Actinoplanes sp.]